MNTIRIIDTKGAKRQLEVGHIEYLSGLENYSLIHIQGEKPVLVSLTLKVMAQRLPGFLLIHKRTLLNPQHIVDYQLENIRSSMVRLSQDRLLAVSRRRVRFLLGSLKHPTFQPKSETI